MTNGVRPGRPRRYAAYERLSERLMPGQKKRPAYIDGVGLLKGKRATTVWVRLNLRRGGVYAGRSHMPGSVLEVKLGNLSEWPWDDVFREKSRLQARADRGEPLEDHPQRTFQDQALAWLRRKERTARGIGTLRSHVLKHLIPEFGKLNLADISLGQVNEWQARLLDRVTPATVLRVRATLSAILQQALKEGLLDRNVSSLAEAPGVVQPRERWLSSAELKALFEAADQLEAEGARIKQPNHRKGWLREFLTWCLHSGMRRQEILNLTFDHIREVPGGFQVTIEKSKSGRSRAIACNEPMIDAVARLRALQRAPGDNRLFPVSSITVKRAVAKALDRAGLVDVWLHDLRRTHATALAYANVDLRTLASRLGHRDLAMLEKHYAMAVEDRKAAIAAQEAFISI